jgi:hypothetical protein
MEKATPFGQNEVFHTLSYNIPHLDTWIDEIIKLTEKSLPAKANPTTQDMVESVHRYDACFREMLRQTNTFSPDLTRIYAKLWIGVLGLLDSMVKMYHRHVTQTASLQEQARELIHQRQAQVAATKIKQEEEVLERTALRATIRNLEGEIEAIKSSNRELDRENRGLRALVETYIDARDFDRTLLTVVANGQIDPTNEVPAKRRSAADSSRVQMETLNHLDVQINEILAGIQTEEDRQLAILSQVDNLLSTNEEMLINFRSHYEQQREEEGVTTTTTKEIGIQVDEKDSFGLVDDHTDTNAEDLPEFPPGPVAIPNLFTANSVTVPFELRRLMSSFPHVLRIPSLEWTKQSILSIYFSKIRNDTQFAKLILRDGKKTLPAYLHEYYTALYGLPLIADMQIMVLLRACILYAGISKRVWLFSEQLGLAETEKLPTFGIRDTDLILSIIASLQEQGEFQPIQPSSTLAKSKANPDRSSEYTPTPASGEGESPGVISPYIKRASALSSAQTIFEKWLPDTGNEYLMKIRAMPNAKGSFHVDFDDFLEITMEQWLFVKGLWVEHLACLFHYNSSIFRVISEAQFATESGNPDRDTVLAQMIRDPANPLGTRPARIFSEAAISAAAAAAKKASLYERNLQEFQRFKEEGINLSRKDKSIGKASSVAEGSAGGEEETQGEVSTKTKKGSSEKEEKSKKDGGGGGDSMQSGGMKESVVDFMSKKSFVSALRNLKPDLGSTEVPPSSLSLSHPSLSFRSMPTSEPPRSSVTSRPRESWRQCGSPSRIPQRSAWSTSTASPATANGPVLTA